MKLSLRYKGTLDMNLLVLLTTVKEHTNAKLYY